MIEASSWFLARRYLLTRWVNVLGVLGIAVAVWALVFVTSIFSGFIAEIRDGTKEASPDLLVTGLPEEASYQALAPVLAADEDVVATAHSIIEDVRARGDAALLDYTKRFDRLDLAAGGLRISEEDFAKAEGCAAMRVKGRRGWARVLKGYRVKSITLEKELG